MISISPGAVQDGAALSPRLKQTLVCLLEGNTEKQVAARLSVSPSTVHQYVTALYRRFGVASRGQLLAGALQHLDPRACEPPPPSDGSTPSELSPRLRETLEHLLLGKSEKEVARLLRLSPATTHQYVTALYRRFGVGSRPQLLARLLSERTRGCWQPLLERMGLDGAAHR